MPFYMNKYRYFAIILVSFQEKIIIRAAFAILLISTLNSKV